MNRRTFLKTAAAVAPSVITSNALGNGAIPPASDRINIGFIGNGTRGGDGLIKMFLPLPDAQCVATCDCFKDRRERWAKRIEDSYAERSGQGSFRGCAPFSDFRELLERKEIDAVAIATPDHWHVPAAMAAIRAGKDLYLEKPLGLSINQGKALRAAIRKSGRVFQYGTQQRSSRHIRYGCELVRNGRIGKVHTVVVLAPNGARGGSSTPMPVPEGFDYEMWSGPAPVRPYTDDRCLRPGHYHIYDYCLGYIAGWGAHPLDVAQWGLGTDGTSPTEYEGAGYVPKTGLYDAVANWTVRCRYAGGIVMHFMDDHSNLTKFIGTEGWVAISRSALDAEPKSLLKSEIGANELHLHESGNHGQDFLNSVRSREETVNPIESAVRSDAISHLSNIAIRTGRGIRWDPIREVILDDAEAARMLERPLRAPWTL
ncbi:MAG: Gfo/Idh/MocA family oxidoreductase [Acidobacteriota bacterium]